MQKHKHHIVPRHAGGSDSQDNIIELTVEEHAEAHKKLWEQHGMWQDYIAWQGLSGRIGKEEIIRERARLANLGRQPWHKNKKIGLRSEETKRKISETMKSKGIRPSEDTISKAQAKAHSVTKGSKLDESVKARISITLKQYYKDNPKQSKPLSENHKQKISVSLMKPVEFKGKKYSSLKECKESTGLSRHHLIKDLSFKFI